MAWSFFSCSKRDLRGADGAWLSTAGPRPGFCPLPGSPSGLRSEFLLALEVPDPPALLQSILNIRPLLCLLPSPRQATIYHSPGGQPQPPSVPPGLSCPPRAHTSHNIHSNVSAPLPALPGPPLPPGSLRMRPCTACLCLPPAPSLLHSLCSSHIGPLTVSNTGMPAPGLLHGLFPLYQGHCSPASFCSWFLSFIRSHPKYHLLAQNSPHSLFTAFTSLYFSPQWLSLFDLLYFSLS